MELAAVPFFPQSTDQCGPSALTTVLQASGVDAPFDQVAAAIYLPERRGSLQLELLSAARAYGRLPVQLDPDLPGLVAQLQLGRPVLVMQNLGIRLLPLWHYAVVVGYLPDEDALVLRSGRRERLLVPRARFDRAWARAERWALVLLAPDQRPTGVDEQAYLAEAAALEATGEIEIAGQAYREALTQWPDSPLAALGLAKVLYAEGQLQQAIGRYRALLAADPNNLIARNNLADSLLNLGCPDAALAVIDAAPPGTAQHPLYGALQATRAEVAAALGASDASAAICPVPYAP
ncbi:MAG: PA2778 family cysteine peptidase [Pseudomonadales bacterium]